MADINPSSLATQLATAYIQPSQSLLTTQSKNADAVSSALTKLQSALQAFDSALIGLSGKKTLLQYSASFSTTGFATATTTAGAQAGTYSLFVEQLATAHQVAFQALPTAPAASAGSLTVSLASGTSFSVDFTGADSDADGTLSQTEIARAINQAPDNKGQVSAMLVSSGGTTQLVLTAASTGAGSQITLDTSAIGDAGLQAALSAGTDLVAAKDAIVWLGDQNTGLKVQQASNTVTAIPGVSLTLTQAMAPGATPLTLTVASDSSGTAANVRSFVDAYNALNKVLDELTDTSKVKDGGQAAALTSDAGVRALRNRLNALIRQDVGGLQVVDFGISADRNGNLTLKESTLQKGLAAHPGGLDTLFGSTSITASSGVLGSLDRYLGLWLNSTSGQIKQRQDSVQRIQKSITTRQARLDDQYSKAYERYLKQFTQLQTLQSQMSDTSTMLAGLSISTSK